MRILKIICVAVVITSLCAYTGVAQSSSSFHSLFDENFESVSGTAVSYIASGESGITTTTTNSGIKNYDFINRNNNNSLKFTGYTTEEMAGNATRSFSMNFSRAYNLTDFKDTKLVVSFKEYIEKADSGSYVHTVVNGTTGGSTKALSQMFWEQNVGDGPKYRCNNIGPVGGKVNLNQEISSVYVFDLDAQTFDFYLNGNKFAGNSYQTKSEFSDITGLTFMVEKNQIFSIDDICVYTISTKANPVVISDPSFDNENNVSIESSFEALVSTYITQNSYSDISVSANGLALPSDSYTIYQKAVAVDGKDYVALTIDFKDKMDYETYYEITFGENIEDILGNKAGGVKTYSYTTEKEPKILIESLLCKSGIFNSGDIIENISEAKGKYTCFTMTTKGDIENPSSAVCVIAVYNENDEMIDCGFSEFYYEKDSRASFEYSTYLPETTKNVKAFVYTDFSGAKLISDILIFE